MTFGWSWEYIDDFMTIPRLLEMTEYWEKYPPLHVMVAQYFEIGGKRTGSTPQHSGQVGTIDDLLNEFGDFGGKIDPAVWS